MLLSADAGRNTVFAYHPTRERSGFALNNRVNLITSLTADNPRYVWNDSANHVDPRKWFRPSDVVVGTDGSLFIADWYDPVVGGHQMRDTAAYGRIYRIVPKGKRLRAPDLDFTTTPGLIEAIKNPAVNVRFEAARLLAEKGDTIVNNVSRLLEDENPFIRYRAIWILSRSGSKGRNEVVQLLSNEDDETRVVALRALRQAGMLMPMTNDPSPIVRREVATALADGNPTGKRELLVELALSYPVHDRWYASAIASAASGYEDDLYTALTKDTEPLNWSPNVAQILWTLHPFSAASDFELRARRAPNVQDRLEAITALAFIPQTSAARAMLRLAQDSTDVVREQALYWASFRRSNDWYALLDWSKTPLDAEYQNTLAAMKVKMNMALNAELSEHERSRNAAQLASNPIGGRLLLTKLTDNTFPGWLIPTVAKAVSSNPDPGVRYQVMRMINKPSGQAVTVSNVVEIQGDASIGNMVFEKNCISCHAVNGKGGTAGPDLSNIATKYDRSALIDAIVDPDAGVAFGYEAWALAMNDKSTLIGFVVADNKNTLIVRDLSGKLQTLNTTDVVSRTKQEGSLMPSPSELGMSAEEVAHVVAYLSKLTNQ